MSTSAGAAALRAVGGDFKGSCCREAAGWYCRLAPQHLEAAAPLCTAATRPALPCTAPKPVPACLPTLNPPHETAAEVLSYGELKEATKLPDEDLTRCLASLVLSKYKLLSKVGGARAGARGALQRCGLWHRLGCVAGVPLPPLSPLLPLRGPDRRGHPTTSPWLCWRRRAARPRASRPPTPSASTPSFQTACAASGCVTKRAKRAATQEGGACERSVRQCGASGVATAAAPAPLAATRPALPATAHPPLATTRPACPRPVCPTRPQVPLPPVDDRRKVQEDVDKDRKHAIEAAIVRIMKASAL